MNKDQLFEFEYSFYDELQVSYKRRDTLLYRRECFLKHRNKIKRIANDVYGWIPSGYLIRNNNGKEYVRRFYRGQRSSYLKQVGNKAVRRYKHSLPNKGDYKKVFDFWWSYW